MRYCCVCFDKIHACMGFALVGDFYAGVKHVREVCGRCALVFVPERRWED